MSFHSFGLNGSSINGIYPLSSASSSSSSRLVVAGRRKKSSSRKGELRAPLRPPSFFIKQSPVPARRPLRCVPTTLLSDSGSEAEPSLSTGKLVGEPLKRKKQQQQATNVQVGAAASKDKADRVSKWASLFEAAKSSTPATGTSPAKDADAWFDKIFPKNADSAVKEGGTGKLSAQQEKSIQQLQTLVKTLGVATRNPAGPTTPPRSKASKLRQLPPVQGGVDPVPFSSILKKLQSVSSSQHQEVQASGGSQVVHKQVEEEEVEEVEEPVSGEDEAQDEEEGAMFVDEDKAEQLFGMTVLELRGIAKAKGLSGYSKLRKEELVKLLVPHCS